MTDPRPTSRLHTDRNLWLCTLRPDGSPHVTPIWFVWHDQTFWCCTTSTSVKVRNLTNDPRVAVTLEDGDRPIVAEGRARLYRRPYPQPIVDAFHAKFAWDIRHPDTDGDWATLIAIRPDRWLLGDPT